MNPDRYLVEPDLTDYDTLADEQDTRAADDADTHRKGEN